MRLAHAAQLLAAARSVAGLAPLARAAGVHGPPAPLPASARRTLALDEIPLGAVHIARGHGALRTLLADVPPGTPLRDAARALAARLAARGPHLLWLLALVQADGSALALAAWTPDPRPGRAPRLVALHCHPPHLVDSDADTLRALAAHAPPTGAAPGADLRTHAAWLDVLGRDALGHRFYHALHRTVAQLGESAAPTVADAAARADLALLYTSRLLFLAFLEAKHWLDGDHAFLAHRFDACMTAGGAFHRRVLLPLFFGTLNTPRRHRAPAARAFGRVPFLNGGLFAPTALERRHRALRFDDAALGALVHDLVGHYRFTAREDAATWSEAAVDPEMLGRAFESLMHACDRRATGAFYTPQPLVEHVTTAALRHALGSPSLAARCRNPVPYGRDGPGRDRAAPLSLAVIDAALAGDAVGTTAAARLRDRAASIRILDPACGSGAFLVHTLERLSALLTRCGDPRPVSDVRRAVLATSIFGVDVNPTAVWLTELRLWLSVVIDAECDDPARVPPLPNLDHNVRVGDTLAVPSGLELFAHATWGGAPWGTAGPAERSAGESARMGAHLGRPSMAVLRARYAALAGRRKHAAARRLDAAERAGALATLDRALARLKHARAELLARARARDLFGARPAAAPDTRARLATLRSAVRTLTARRRAVAHGAALPFGFAWHFADAAAAGGFDAVIGNPPWVRPHAVPATDRPTLRAAYECARHAAWTEGLTLAGAGAGFAGQADLAALFTERSLALLRPGGVLALLLPAKLWRTLAGGGLRRLVAREARLIALEDWSEAPPSFDAAVYPSLLVAERTVPDVAPPASARSRCDAVDSAAGVDLRVHRAGAVAVARVPAYALPVTGAPDAPWLLLPPNVRRAFDHLRAAGPSLAASGLTRPTLGVKCGCNDAFVVRIESGDDDVAAVRHRDRRGVIERALLRPVLRGEQLATRSRAAPDAPPTEHDQEWLLWPYDPAGRLLTTLPRHAARWLAPWRTRLVARSDARGRSAWWSLFRVEAADPARARVVWADLARAPHPRYLPPGDPHVPLNSCYAAAFDDPRDARAFAALLAAPPISAWLGALAEPARGGYRRHLAWTVALLPVPRDWRTARIRLAALVDAPAEALTAAVADVYALDAGALAPLLAWDADTPPAPASGTSEAPHPPPATRRAPPSVCERAPRWRSRAAAPDAT